MQDDRFPGRRRDAHLRRPRPSWTSRTIRRAGLVFHWAGDGMDAADRPAADDQRVRGSQQREALTRPAALATCRAVTQLVPLGRPPPETVTASTGPKPRA